jgi:hypothetical protein
VAPDSENKAEKRRAFMAAGFMRGDPDLTRKGD